MKLFIVAILVGGLSTLVLDLWQRVAFRLGGLPPTNWAMVGRWLLILRRDGIVFNTDLARAPRLPNELRVGWLLHYAVGIVYALTYVLLWKGMGWLAPGWLDGLRFGAISVLVPWFFFMPATGAGVMASRTPRPFFGCVSALVVHSIFGMCMGGFLLWLV